MPSRDVLLERMPAPRRVLSECALLLTLIFGPPYVLGALPPQWSAYGLPAAFLFWAAWAVVLTRRRWPAACASAAAVAAVLWSTTVGAPSVPPRLGVQTTDRAGCAQVTGTIAGTPADGTLRAGDCITAIGGAALDRQAPTADLRARLADPLRLPPGATALVVTRHDAPAQLSVTLGPVVRGPQLRGADLPWLLFRSLAALVLIAALLSADGQSLRHIGLDAPRLPRELLYGVPALAGAYAVHIAVAVPVSAVMMLLRRTSQEMAQRMGAIQGVVNDVSFWALVPALVVLAAFEEVLFRGFLVPRVRALSGRWWIAVLAVQLAFGFGHLYEGVFAALQTAMLGVYFAVVFLWRVHLGAAIAAHAGFNTVSFALLWFLQRSGLLETLPSLR